MTKRQLPSSIGAAITELKQALQGLYGERLRGVYLYGSYARGTAHADSDVDVLVVLEGPVKPGAEITRMSRAVSEVCLRHNLLISTCPVSAESLETQTTIFLENVRQEALLV